MRIFMICAVCAVLAASSSPLLAEPVGDESSMPGWRQEFKSMPNGWRVKSKPWSKAAEFRVGKDSESGKTFLAMYADNASGTLMTELKNIDLTKTPILRWSWRVTTFPEGADGTKQGKDDQAIAIYVGDSGKIGHRSIAYRWETETSPGEEGFAKYAGGIVQVRWICVRNRDDGDQKKFLVEERNLAEDFKKAFGYVPDKLRIVGIGISCNSEYTGTKAEAGLEWIELRAEPAGESG